MQTFKLWFVVTQYSLSSWLGDAQMNMIKICRCGLNKNGPEIGYGWLWLQPLSHDAIIQALLDSKMHSWVPLVTTHWVKGRGSSGSGSSPWATCIFVFLSPSWSHWVSKAICAQGKHKSSKAFLLLSLSLPPCLYAVQPRPCGGID